jgi:CHRD domain
MEGDVMVRKYLVSRKFDFLAVLSVVMVLFLAGCGGNTSAHASSGTTASSSTNASNSAIASATLKHMPYGTAAISWDPVSKGLTVKISLIGMAPTSTHPANIHAGSCAKPGAMVYPLQNVVADTHGVGSSTTVIQKVTTLPASEWYIAVHNGPGLAPADQFSPIVCSDLTFTKISPAKMTSVQVPLNAAPGSSTSETAKGTAHLTLSGKTLTVKLTLSGLQPKSSHAAHIHAGSCASQGAVIYPLQNVVADASGNANETTTIHNVSSIPGRNWYVNIHYSTDISTQTGFNPIACGNVVVG